MKKLFSYRNVSLSRDAYEGPCITLADVEEFCFKVREYGGRDKTEVRLLSDTINAQIKDER